MSGWRRCDTCRKVRPLEDFDDDAPTCRSCRTAPVKRRTTAVTRTTVVRAAAAPTEVPPSPRRPLRGAVGAGDLEVRERRAKRAALEALATSHPDEYAVLLRAARQAEGLRPLAAEE